MKKERKIILGMLILSVFVLIVALSSLYVQMQIETGNICGCAIPLWIFVPFLSALGLFIGTLTYSFFLPQFKSKPFKKNIYPLLNLVSPEEREILKKIIENGGEILQSKLSSSELSKVKVFRILERLKAKGIIEKENYGKTNIIRLNKEIKKLFD